MERVETPPDVVVRRLPLYARSLLSRLPSWKVATGPPSAKRCAGAATRGDEDDGSAAAKQGMRSASETRPWALRIDGGRA